MVCGIFTLIFGFFPLTTSLYLLVTAKLWFLLLIWHFGLFIFLNCFLLTQGF